MKRFGTTRRWLACCLAMLVAGSLVQTASPLTGQNRERSSFQRFDRRDIPSPRQLLQKLSGLNGLNLNPTLADQIREAGKEWLSGLPPDQQEKMLDLGKELFKNFNNGNPPPEELSQFLEGQLESGNVPDGLLDLARRWTDEQGGVNPGELPRNLFPPPANRNDNSGRNPVNPERRPGNRNRNPDTFRPDSQTPPEGAVRQPPDDADRQPPGDLQQQLEQIFSRTPEEGNRDSGVEVVPDDVASRLDSPPWEGQSGESVGTRFDRMLIDVFENRLASRDDGSGNPLADSVKSLLDDMVGSVHSQMNRRGSTRFGGQSGLSSRLRSPGRSLNLQRFWNGSGSLAAAPDIPHFGWWWLVGLLIALLVLLTWVGWRVVSRPPGEPGPDVFRKRFRMSGIRTPGDLVRAVDGYLLARFGKPSSWWHSRRAEIALASLQPGMLSDIAELVDCYEYARYSEVGEALSGQQVQRCASILGELVSGPPAGTPGAADGES